MERAVLTGIGLFRVVALAWLVAVFALQRHDLAPGWHAALAVVLVAGAAAATLALSLLGARDATALTAATPVVAELVVGAALMALDGLVYAHGHVGSGESALAAAWPLAGVLTAGVAFGAAPGALAGVVIGLARVLSAPLNGLAASGYHSSLVVSFASTAILYALAGGVAGYAVSLLRTAEDEVSAARARDEVSRTLHDGVLQTLALVERQSDDPRLAGLAREQEQELRAFLAGYRTPPRPRGSAQTSGQLEEALRHAATRFEQRFGGRVEVVVAHDLDPVETPVADALVGAVTEALANAGKHGGAQRVTVFVEPGTDARLFCSVKDDGAGFDGAAVREGLGITGSIRGRLQAVGGRVEITSRIGEGTEVQLWV